MLHESAPSILLFLTFDMA